jgi:hypothetical protein
MNNNTLTKLAIAVTWAAILAVLALLTKRAAGYLPSVSVAISYIAVAGLLALASLDYRMGLNTARSR